MPRIRSVKPEFWSSPSVKGADPWVRLLYIAMWNWADDAGRGTANPKELAAFAFPHDDDHPGTPTAQELPSLLKEVRGRFGVVFYEVSGRRYYAVTTFDKHQRTERKATSRLPAPDEGTVYDPGPPDQPKPERPSEWQEAPTNSAGSSFATEGRSGTGTGEQGNRGTGGVPLLPERGAVAPGEPTAQTIVGEWIDRCQKRPPKNVIGQMAKQVRSMLGEGIQPDDIRRGISEWMTKDVHPSVLPSIVNNVMNRTRASPQYRASTDDNIAAFLGGPPQLRAIEGGTA